ncbi:MAG: hypothetical protein QNK14_10110 [Desulfobacterales bacterium]|nr:hypothetical protein [Desulfobacterales bacterium]
MEKLTQKELIRDSHQKLANDYYEWFLLLFHYTDKTHAHDFKISSKDRLELERNPKYIHEIMKKNYNLDITLESERTK